MTLIRVSIVNTKEVRDFMQRINPARNTKIIRNGLVRAALEIQANAADIQIAAGGRGKRKALRPLPDRLTSRSGALRRGIHVDRSDLPFAIEIARGPNEPYGDIHELGLGNYPRRPFMAPALDAIGPRFGDIIVKEWKKAAGLR